MGEIKGMLEFNNRVAIVTGAGRGMGRSHALMLAARGARVVVNDLARDGVNPADAVVAEILAAGGIAVADGHSVLGECEGIVATAIEAFGQLDILVCNAGMMSSEWLSDATEEDWKTVFNTHFLGTVDLCRAAWPHLVKSGSGRVVTVSSSGMLGNTGLTSYGSAKGAIFSFTRSLALEGEGYGIHANAILPSARTRMTDTIPDPAISATIERYFQPEHVSSLVTWLVHQDTQINNEAFQVSGGRAGRIAIAALPTVRVAQSSPEVWAERAPELFAEGPIRLLRTTGEMFFDELADADPSIREALAGASDSVQHQRTSGR